MIYLKFGHLENLARGLDIFIYLLQLLIALGMLILVDESRLINLIYEIRWMGDA